MRIILFTGKGGVGKTTTAAATALQAAKQGYKTLVISTDPAHSLSDALNIELQPEPTPVAENLWGQEFDVYYSMKKYWTNMRELMRTIFKWQGVDNIVAEELSVLPGMEEGSAFLWIEKYYTEKEYDVLVIDSAPTGETLTLLSLPQVTQSWLTKAFPGQKFAMKTFGGLVRNVFDIPLDKGYEELETLFGKLQMVQEVMINPDVTSIRLVANPERMVIQEAKRAYTYLQLYGYNVDAVVVNRVIPEGEGGEFFADYLKAQKGHLQDLKESFDPLPVFQVPHQGKEVFGLELLEKIGNSIYEGVDPSLIFHNENPYKVTETKEAYQVHLKLPFIAEKDFELDKYGDELVINIDNRRKNIFLPRFANFLELKEYAYENGWLKVVLQK
ncbi:MAG: ArsA family ATPase [Bacteroidia bacterium]|nr:ArsA family ATPase [Bacteroidia bacterium]